MSYLFCFSHCGNLPPPLSDLARKRGLTQSIDMAGRARIWSRPADHPLTLVDSRFNVYLNGQVFFIKRYTSLNHNNRPIHVNLQTLLTTEGDRFHEYIDGHFTIIVHDGKHGTLRMYNDVFWKQRVFYTTASDQLLVSDNLGLLADMVGEQHALQLNPDYFLSYIAFGPKYTLLTPYIGINVLPPGFVMQLLPSLVVARYWFPDVDISYYNSILDPHHYAAHAVATFLASLEARTKSARSIIVDFSGGLDSTAILGGLRRLYGSSKNIIPVYFKWQNRFGNASVDASYVNYVLDQFATSGYEIDDTDTITFDRRSCKSLLAAEPSEHILRYKFMERLSSVLNNYPEPVRLNGRGGEVCFDTANAIYTAPTLCKFATALLMRSLKEEKSFWQTLRHFCRITTHVTDFLLYRGLTCVPDWLSNEGIQRAKELVNWHFRVYTKAIRSLPIKHLLLHLMWEWDIDRECVKITIEYPYLDRELIMSNVACAADACKVLQCEPYAQNRALQRKVLKDLVPPKVRDRVNKGGNIHTLRRAFRDNYKPITQLLRRPLLCELVTLDRNTLLRDIDEFIAGKRNSRLLGVLACEVWLRERFGSPICGN